MIVLDTNVISETMRERPDEAVMRWLEGRPRATLWTTAVTIAELAAGIARMPQGWKRGRFEEELAGMIAEDFEGRILPFATASAIAYGRIRATREAEGRPMGLADAQIAAMVAAAGATLATRNVRDFSATGITVVDPWTAVSSPD
ncbi:type II toxin-antitoxin system VapC family toxin [Streptomyces sp. MS2A]|nr:type II toxin-antitoxin system VapC family toxin [Streptomyces sp. MS2A]